jgi:hypothetical protein
VVLVTGAGRGLAAGGRSRRPDHADPAGGHLPEPVRAAPWGAAWWPAALPAHRPGPAPPTRQAPAPGPGPAPRHHPDPPAAHRGRRPHGPRPSGRRPGARQAPPAVLTLVERTSRSVLLVALPAGWRADQGRPALTAAMERLPERRRRSLTRDQGKETAEHARFSAGTGCRCASATRAAPGSGPVTRTPTAGAPTACPGPPTCAAAARPGWTAPPPSSTAAPDRPSAFRHPHSSWRRRCADPLRPPPHLQQVTSSGPVLACWPYSAGAADTR